MADQDDDVTKEVSTPYPARFYPAPEGGSNVPPWYIYDRPPSDPGVGWAPIEPGQKGAWSTAPWGTQVAQQSPDQPFQPDLSQLGSYTNVPSKGGPSAKSLTASTDDAQSILNAAVAGSGALSTRGDPGTQGGELACADAVCKILANAGVDIKPTLSTTELQSELVAAGFKKVDPSTPGAVIISPTQGGRHGHTGVVGMDGRIYSNSSAKGMWEQNYTLDSWNRSFGGLGVHAYLPAGSGAAASHPSLTDLGTSGTGGIAKPASQKQAQPLSQKPAPQASIPRAQMPQNTLASSSYMTSVPTSQKAAGDREQIKKMTAAVAPENIVGLPEISDDVDAIYQWLKENPDLEL